MFNSAFAGSIVAPTESATNEKLQLLPDMSYLIPDKTVRFELLVKKSRFIAITGYTADQSQVRLFIDSIAGEFPDARHLCHACILGEPGHGTASSNDDGEPAGTAGKPILNVLQHSGVGDIVTVVVRYFGGIKLGAGGLVRAYSNAAAGSLKLLSTTIEEHFCELEFTIDFAAENQVRQILLKADARELTPEYKEQLKFNCKLPEPLANTTIKQLVNITRGQIIFTKEPLR